SAAIRDERRLLRVRRGESERTHHEKERRLSRQSELHVEHRHERRLKRDGDERAEKRQRDEVQRREHVARKERALAPRREQIEEQRRARAADGPEDFVAARPDAQGGELYDGPDGHGERDRAALGSERAEHETERERPTPLAKRFRGIRGENERAAEQRDRRAA